MSFIDDVIKRVRDYDRSRPRSVQVAVGWSEVGGCRAALGYRLRGDFITDDPDTWAAQRGTAIHEYLQTALDGDGVWFELDTEYRGIPGHVDMVDGYGVTDFKTTSLANSKLWATDHSLLRPKRIQAHGYAAGLVDEDRVDEEGLTVRLLIIPVDGTFADWWAYEEPFDRSLADEGADRLEDVRERMARGEPLPKDKPYAWCVAWCPFVSMCRDGDDPKAAEVITDPEMVAAVTAYGETHAVYAAAEKEKKRLAGIIRGLRGTAGEWRIGLSKPGEPKEVIDEEWIRADYAARGETVPTTWAPGAAAKLSVTRIKKAGAT